MQPRKRSNLTTQFTEIAQSLLSATGEMAHLLTADPAERPTLLVKVGDAELATADAGRRIERLLRAALVTPYDRHDLTDVAQLVVRAADRVEEAADLATRYRVTRLPDSLLQQAQVLERSCDVLASGITHLRVASNMTDAVVELDRLANHGEVLHRQTKTELLRDRRDLREAIATLDVARAVADGAHTLRAVASVVQRMRVKEA